MLAKVLGFQEFTGRHMIGVMVLFFGTIISVNLTLAWFATHSWTGLVVKNSYVESQKFNGETERRLHAAALNWQADIRADRGGISLILRDAQDRIISDAIVTISIGRPTHEQEDRTLTLVEAEAGTYSAISEFGTGLWAGEVTAVDEDAQIWIKPIRVMVEDAE